MQAKINLSMLKAANLAASSEETRYYLNGVFVEISRRRVTYTATNGHVLFTVKDDLQEAKPGKVHEYGIGKATRQYQEPGEEADDDNTLLGAWIIPASVIKGIKLPKFKDKALAARARLESEGAMKRLTLVLSDGTSIGFEPIDGCFPDYRRVIPRETKQGELVYAYNPEYLNVFWKIGEALAIGKPEIAYNEDGPALMLYTSQDAVGVIMPLRGSRKEARAPGWIREQPGMGESLPKAA
jgi:DNA polymerase III subunit beta